MKKLILFLGILGLTFVSAQPAAAVSADEKIKSFDSKVLISGDNTAHISETIVYDFGSSSHHGIYRDIPIDYYDKTNTYYLTCDYDQTTDENGMGVRAKVSEVEGNQRIRLGDPDRTITGIHTYKISYTLHPIITKKDGKPFLNLDVIGEGWQVPIEKASATVVLLSPDTQMSNIAWFASKGRTAVQQGPSNKTSFSVEGLNPYRGVTINATLPDGYVSKYLEPNQKRPIDWSAIIKEFWHIGIFLGVLLIFALGSGIRWWRSRLKRKGQIVVAQYEPPTTLSPAEVGHLEDDSSDMAEVTATLIDMAVRGYMRINQEEKSGITGIFGVSDYVLTRLKPATGLTSNEITLYTAIFKNGDKVNLNSLDKSATATAVSRFKADTKSALEAKGYYDRTGSVLKRGTLTDAGAKEWALVDGFKLFLNVVEKDRLKFTDAPEKTPERFSKLLPYAVALGVEKQWAKQFEGIDLTKDTDWYYGNNLAAFSAASLVSDLNGGFSSAVASNSSVSSGGGSAGGGFGGGGGGSW